MSIPQFDVKLFVEARWKTHFREGVWESLKESGEFHQDEPVPWVDLGPAFLDPANPLSAPFADASCGWNREAEQMHWMLRRVPAPSGNPSKPVVSETVVKLSKKLGGLTGLEQILRSATEGPPVPIASYTIRVTLPQSKGWNCRLLHRQPADTANCLDDLGSTNSVEQIGIRFENGTNGLEEFVVMYGHERSLYHLRISGRSRLDFGPSLELPFGPELAELVIPRAFEFQEKEPLKI